jgi:hypothetical protein
MRVLGEVARQACREKLDACVSRAKPNSRDQTAVDVDISRIDAHSFVEQQRSRESARLVAVRFSPLRSVDAFQSDAYREALSIAHTFDRIPVRDSNNACVEGLADKIP